MPRTTTFSCSCTTISSSTTTTTNPALPPRTPYPPPQSFPFPCRSCAREQARDADSDIKARYDPQIAQMRETIENALWHLTGDNEPLKRAIERKQGEEYALMVRRERELIRCWRGFRERWE
ncbi:hypothetical protein BDR22DRAFT_823126 [Usnea florida]